MKRLIIITFLVFISLSFLTISCTKQQPDGDITFWISENDGCGEIIVSIEDQNVGTITNWQVISPSNCTGSNTLLNVTTQQGEKTVKYTNNCRTWYETIQLNSDCFIQKVF